MKIFFLSLLYIVSIGIPAMAEDHVKDAKAAKAKDDKAGNSKGEAGRKSSTDESSADKETAEQEGAEQKQPCPKRPRKKRKARKLAGNWFSKASKLVEEDKYLEAVEAFRCSYEMVAHPATLINGAKAAKLGEDYDAGLDFLGTFLEQYPKDDKVEQVKEQLAELQAKRDQQLEAKKAEEKKREQERQDAARAAALTEKEQQGAVPDRERGKKIAGYVLLGVGAAGLVTGAVLQGLAGAAVERGQDTEDPQVYEDARSDMKKLQAGAIGAFAVGGAALIAGIVIVLVAKKEPQAEDLSILPTTNGLMIRGTF